MYRVERNLLISVTLMASMVLLDQIDIQGKDNQRDI